MDDGVFEKDRREEQKKICEKKYCVVTIRYVSTHHVIMTVNLERLLNEYVVNLLSTLEKPTWIVWS